ncbi:MAG: LicD family protein [Lachnospiraceae bacterium]|nr:LicD family protein [Lachnospiraceae bacterium]
MSHSIDFLKDEVRNGFYITTPIKQAWAETLDVLAEIDRICRKYDIRYFADWGTFLGAVRHGGFVPWDDDLDICMLRDDYVRFRQVADSELPEQFMIHDYASKEGHWLFLSRVVNNHTMCFDESYLDKHNNFPWLTGVDIFIKDYLYDDDCDEIERDKEILNILAVADGVIDGSLSRQAVCSEIEKLQEKYSYDLSKESNDHELAVALYRLAETQMSRVLPKDSKRVGQIFPWVIKRRPGCEENKEIYDNIIYLPFEDTKIPVPAAYNRSLLSRYGNTYCEIKKVWGGHDYPFFEGQKAEMERLLDNRLPGFYFERSMLTRLGTDKSASYKETAKDCFRELEVMLSDAMKSLADRNYEDFMALISDSQQLAADLGTLIEKTRGEDDPVTLRITTVLQGYCDALWEDYQAISNGEDKEGLTLSRSAFERLCECIKTDLLNRKEILFLTTGAKEWKGFEIYHRNLSDMDTDIYVVYTPLMKRSFTGKVVTPDEDRCPDHLPDDVRVIDHRFYDISIHCPDVIYVQYPYDSYNPCLTIPQEFFVRNLQRYSEKIIFIPPYKIGEFDCNDRNDIYNLRHYAVSPAVIYADKVILQSENIKERYVEVLCDAAGEDTKEIWVEKIHVEDTVRDQDRDCEKKKLLICVGENEVAEHKERFPESLKRKMDHIIMRHDKVQLFISLYPGDKNEWLKADKTVSERVFEELEKMSSEYGYEWVDFNASNADEIAERFDAYYGSPSPLVPAFNTKGKPVMLADYGK